MRLPTQWLGQPAQVLLAWGVGIAFVLAALSNGAGFYLKRTGLMDADAYRQYWPAHCRALVALSPAYAVRSRCCELAAVAAVAEGAQPDTASVDDRPQIRHLYSAPGSEILLKLAKDGFGLALFALSLFMLAKRHQPFPAVKHAWPVHLFLAYAGAAFLASLWFHGPLTAGAGLRPFMFVALAVVGLWLVPHRAFFASCAGALLILELSLMPFEILRGVHLHGHFYTLPFAGRASGTLVLPNTLGVFAVSALAFYYSFAPNRPWIRGLGLTTLALILASGSATGLVCMGLFVYVALIERIAPNRRIWFTIVAALVFVALAVSLPTIIGRQDAFNSILGSGERVDGIRMALTSRGILETIFGGGLGVNTNTAINVVRELGAGMAPNWERVHLRPTDAMLTGLLVQVGVAGTFLFYAVLGWASLNDRDARMFYLIIATSSLTLNVIEIFPVNFLLGVALAHSVTVAGTARR